MSARILALVLCASFLAAGCYRDSHSSAPDASAEQKIVDRSAEAFRRIRSSQHPALEYFVEHAHGVMIFPRIIKASMIFGGEGGNGVLLAKDGRGWSAPAFYSLGAGSAGLQVGYQEATVVLFFMKEAALRSTIERGITLGTDASVAAGTVGGTGAGAAGTAASDIYQFVEVGGLFAGLSLDGTVVGARDSFNQAYYGAGATPQSILIERRHTAPGAATLHQVLALQVPAAPAGGVAPPALDAGATPPIAPDAGATTPTESKPIPPQAQCKVATDCTLTSWACSPCGGCYGPSWAVNAAWLARSQKECKPWPKDKQMPNCAPCPPPASKEVQKTWPTRAVCEAGMCQAR